MVNPPLAKFATTDDLCLALSKDLTGSLEPKVGDLTITSTTPDSLSLRASVNLTNPTPYSARIPFISIHILHNGTLLGEARAENIDITTGNNTNLIVSATWNPSMTPDGGHKKKKHAKVAHKVARDLISQYISGFNTSVTLRPHAGSIPARPKIGAALSRLNVTVAAPKIHLPPSDGNNGDEDDSGHFIRDATFHILSSTATFTLVSPLTHNVIYIDSVNATALYNHTEPLGRIEYFGAPFAAPPGRSTTPKLPVDWSLDSVGYEKMREALGGRLRLDARATVGVRVGEWTQEVWYVGRGIGASIRI